MVYKKNFIFLSEIIRLPLLDAEGHKIGSITDISSVFQTTYPKVTGLIIKRRGGAKAYLSWKDVLRIRPDRKAVLLKEDYVIIAESDRLKENEILLKETFLDKQVVNISGSRVVRVNDLQLLHEAGNLWLIHIDVGFKSFLRRLGYLKIVNFLYHWLFSYEFKDHFIPWKFVQPITTTTILDSAYLKISFSKLSELHPADLADIIDELGTEEGKVIFQSLDNETAAKTLQEMPLKLRIRMTDGLDLKRLASIVEEMPMDEVVDLLDSFQEEKKEGIFSLLPLSKVVEIEELLAQSSLGAGSLMNTEFISFAGDTTVQQAVKQIKTEYSKIESIYYIYVVDQEECLTGVLTLRHLLTAKAKEKLSELMWENVISVKIHSSIKSVAQIFFKYNFTVVPVVDGGNHLKGIISMKDALESVFPEIREEAEGK